MLSAIASALFDVTATNQSATDFEQAARRMEAELIAEIAASSASYDLNDKLKAYRRNEVQEYIVWQIYENCLDWFSLHEGRYVSLQPDQAGVIRSHIFPGLWLAVNALREGNLAQVLAILQQGRQTAEHQAFVERLNPQQ